MSFWNTKNDPAEMPFLDHLEELRKRLFISIVSVVIGSIIGFVVVQKFHVLVWLSEPIKPFLDPADPRHLSGLHRVHGAGHDDAAVHPGRRDHGDHDGARVSARELASEQSLALAVLLSTVVFMTPVRKRSRM